MKNSYFIQTAFCQSIRLSLFFPQFIRNMQTTKGVMKIKPVSKDDYIDSAEQYANAANGYIKENATFIEISMIA